VIKTTLFEKSRDMFLALRRAPTERRARLCRVGQPNKTSGETL
jgi:hypothetical protein